MSGLMSWRECEGEGEYGPTSVVSVQRSKERMSDCFSSFPQQRSSRLSLSWAVIIVGRAPRVPPRARQSQSSRVGSPPGQK
jgi:hypothetical protein